MIGQTISHYRILEKLGEGGMGVVYKAQDTKLTRTVALKFVPPDAAGDPELRTRFLQEAQAAAALSHPNVCTVYEIDEECGFLAMEFVEGETIQERVRRRPLPIPEALDIAMQAAQGLQAAHERGIVHRDIKGANLMVTPQGAVKIMDFGLARLTGRTRVTKVGTAVGTPAYMSPEQAQGKAVDRRTDLWSLGVVLYEMVTGQMPFRGESEAAVAHSILHEDPEPVSALRAGLPLELDRVIGKALAKDPGERYQHAEDLLVDLRTLRGRLQLESKAARRAATATKRRGILAAALTGLIVGVAGVGLWNWAQARTAAPPPVVRFSFDLPQGHLIVPSWSPGLMFSPDGAALAYGARIRGVWATFLRPLDALEAKQLPDTPAMSTPVFSPDGRYLILIDNVNMNLKKVALSGGAPALFATCDMMFRGDWAADNYYYWSNSYFGPIVRTPGSGGNAEPVSEIDLGREERSHRHAQMLPGGKAIIFTVSSGGIDSFDDARIDLHALGTKKRKTLVQGGFCARYSPSGHIVYSRGGSLFAMPFDVGKLAVTGSPVKVADGVLMSTNSGSAYYDVSRTGALAYAVGAAEGGQRTLVSVDRQGKAAPLSLPPRSYLFPRISPDGKQLAVEVEGANHDLYTYDFDRAVMTKITTDGLSHAPVWTPDGKHIAFRSWKAGTMTMWWMPSDRSGPEERLTTVGARQSLVAFSPDGRYASFNQMEPGGTGSDAWVLPMQGERKPLPLLKSKSAEGSARFSPDGKWVTYCTNESGQNEVFVQPWPGPGPRIQVSSEGGTDPMWSRGGKELFYRNGDKMMVVEVTTQPTFRASRPRLLWESHFSHGMSSSCGPPGTTEANYDVTGDGQRFLMVKDLAQDVASTRIVVVLNFAEELKRLTAAAKSQ
jgi:Tol biopolymer transport system component/predicted Ser/Thr protein kinase